MACFFSFYLLALCQCLTKKNKNMEKMTRFQRAQLDHFFAKQRLKEIQELILDAKNTGSTFEQGLELGAMLKECQQEIEILKEKASWEYHFQECRAKFNEKH